MWTAARQIALSNQYMHGNTLSLGLLEKACGIEAIVGVYSVSKAS